MEKNIKDYLHLYLGCEVEITDNKQNSFTGILTLMDLLDFNAKIINAKPILRPVSDMSEEDFYSFFDTRISENEIIIKATINNMWTAGFYDKKEYQERIDEDLPIDEASLIYDLEEADYTNVISVGKRGGDLAYGCNDEMRYFTELPLISDWINHLRKRNIDADGLIEAGIAISATTLKQQ